MFAAALHNQQQSIFTISLHPAFPNPPIAISGGEDDAGFIFCPIPADSETSASSSFFSADTFPPTKLTGHTDSVVAAGWSCDGEMVATGGMDGKVIVWQRVKPQESTDEASVDEWKNWSMIQELETGTEITVGDIRPDKRSDLTCISGYNGIPKVTSLPLVVRTRLSGYGTVCTLASPNFTH